MKWIRIGGRIGTVAALWIAATTGILSAEHRPQHPHVSLGDVAFTVVGQVTNTPPDQSIQYGYIPSITGLTDVFSSPIENETTAFFTFFTRATTKAVRSDGPLTIVEREGTTTVYYNTAPHGNFSDPGSFDDGEIVLVMSLRQQVILDTTTGLFTVVNINEVTSTTRFEIGGEDFVLARRDAKFRTSLTGRLNAAPPPTGYFAGYAVKIQGD